MSQTIPDIITMPSAATGTVQTITTTVVSDFVVLFSSSPQQIGLKGMYYEVLAVTAATGMASGLTIQIRADTAASLASGSQMLLASVEAVTAAELAAGSVITIPLPSIVLPSTYLYMGLWYLPVSEAVGGLTVISSLKQGGESVVT